MDQCRIYRSARICRSGPIYRWAWGGVVLLAMAGLFVGLYPADRESVAAIQRGERLLAERRYAEALQAYRTAAQRCPGCPGPHLRQFTVYLAQQRYDEAWQAYLTAVRLGGVSDETAAAGVRLALAEQSESTAIGPLQDLVRRRPGQGEFWVWLGQAYLATGRAAEAQHAFEAALGKDISPGEQQAIHDHLAALCIDGDIPCALQHWTAAQTGPDAVLSEHATRLVAALNAVAGLEGQPSGDDERALVRARLGEALLRYGNLTLARGQFEKALELAPAYADAHAYLGYVFSLLGENGQATAHLEQAISLQPTYTLAHYFLGMHYARIGWWVSAQDSLLRAYDLDPTNPAICAAVADTFLRGDEPAYAIAERWFHAAVDNAPTDARFHLLLAHFYVDGMVDPSVRGVAVAQVAVDLAPDNSEAQETLAWAYYLAGQPELALGPLLRAHELSPDEPRISYRLGEVYRALGDWDRSQQYYQAAVDGDWHGPIGARARQAMMP